MLRILVRKREHEAWIAEARLSHLGVVSAFARDRINHSIEQNPSKKRRLIMVSVPTAERIARSGRSADDLINEALDRDEDVAKLRAANEAIAAAAKTTKPKSTGKTNERPRS